MKNFVKICIAAVIFSGAFISQEAKAWPWDYKTPEIVCTGWSYGRCVRVHIQCQNGYVVMGDYWNTAAYCYYVGDNQITEPTNPKAVVNYEAAPISTPAPSSESGI